MLNAKCLFYSIYTAISAASTRRQYSPLKTYIKKKPIRNVAVAGNCFTYGSRHHPQSAKTCRNVTSLSFLCVGGSNSAFVSRPSARFFSSRQNWASPTPSPAGECVFPFGSGGDTLACGGSNSDEGTDTVVLKVYKYFVPGGHFLKIHTQCTEKSMFFLNIFMKVNYSIPQISPPPLSLPGRAQIEHDSLG